jgi:geranylgeranyl reductase family protein
VAGRDEQRQIAKAVRVDAPNDRAKHLHASRCNDHEERAHSAFRCKRLESSEEDEPRRRAENQLAVQTDGHVDPEDGEEERDDKGGEDPGTRSHPKGQNRGVRRYDAIVVGAGPAGSTAAYRLAAAGADVLLLDRATFPRDKPCGGGVTERAVRLLPFSIDPVVEDVATSVDLRLRYGRTLRRGDGEPLVYLTQRKRLDLFLAEQAAAAGAEFLDGTRVAGVESGEGGIAVLADGTRYEAQLLIGADGVNGVTARALELGGNQHVGVALEGNLPGSELREDYRGKLVLEFGVVPGGYGWVFPKGDHVNFGVGGWGGAGPALRDHLRQLCEAHGVSAADLEQVRGYRLPLRSPRSTLARGRALVVGDAAGLIDPVSGDGMFEGFLSSQYAAAAALDLLAGRASNLDPYGPRLAKRLATHLWASWGVKVALDRFPRSTFALASTRIVWGAVERIVRGDVADVSGVGGLARPPLKLVKLLVRASGDPGRAFRGA